MVNFNNGTLYYNVGSPYLTDKQRIESLTEDEDIKVDKVDNALTVQVAPAGMLNPENKETNFPSSFLKADYNKTMPENLFSMVRTLIANYHYDPKDDENKSYYRQDGMVQNPISKEEYNSLNYVL